MGGKAHDWAALLVQDEGFAAPQHVMWSEEVLTMALSVCFARLHRLKLFTLTNHVEASSVAVQVHVLWSDLHVVVCVDAVGARKEAVQTRLGIELLDHVEEAHDDVVATRCLTSRQDATNLKAVEVGYDVSHKSLKLDSVMTSSRNSETKSVSTYAERHVRAEDRAVFRVNHDLQLLHAFSA